MDRSFAARAQRTIYQRRRFTHPTHRVRPTPSLMPTPPDTPGSLALPRRRCSSAAAPARPDYVKNGLKVGPEYTPAKAEVAPQWIDSTDPRVVHDAADLGRWWSVFNDPALDDLLTTPTARTSI